MVAVSSILAIGPLQVSDTSLSHASSLAVACNCIFLSFLLSINWHAGRIRCFDSPLIPMLFAMIDLLLVCFRPSSLCFAVVSVPSLFPVLYSLLVLMFAYRIVHSPFPACLNHSFHPCPHTCASTPLMKSTTPPCWP
jgi:hypothetical protein